MQCEGQVLELFEKASGLKVNVEKSSVAFSHNTPVASREALAKVLGVTVVERHVKYLGLPANVGLSKKVCASKDVGGLGLRRMSAVNQAMRAKQLWRLITQPNSLISRIWKQRYFPSSELSDARAVAGCSFTWRSILATRDVIVAGSRWHIGNRRLIRIWTDRWIPRPTSFQVITAPNTLSLQATINELMHANGNWNEEVIREIFRPEDVDAILAMPRDVGGQDRLQWHFEKRGGYSVRSGYKLACQGLGSRAFVSLSGSTSFKPASWNFIWKGTVPPKSWRISSIGCFDVTSLVWFGLCLIFLGNVSIVTTTTCKHGLGDFTGIWTKIALAGVCWYLWWARNKFIFENVILPADEVMNRVWSMEDCFLRGYLGAKELEKSRQAHHRILLRS
ncbi:UNVERIFIED_CONTAM: putative mitochondrial protein [Sesamum latifolium]|uniref:Mitochondrial protein n=1 Tax=Sesamum latifolium TaxID=2727402 RepID=A0AAW2TNJ4_9LAMI